MNAEQIIERLGGPPKVAKICQISSAAVRQWKTKGIPPARRQFLELLRPDVFECTAIQQSHDQAEAA